MASYRMAMILAALPLAASMLLPRVRSDQEMKGMEDARLSSAMELLADSLTTNKNLAQAGHAISSLLQKDEKTSAETWKENFEKSQKFQQESFQAFTTHLVDGFRDDIENHLQSHPHVKDYALWFVTRTEDIPGRLEKCQQEAPTKSADKEEAALQAQCMLYKLLKPVAHMD